MIDRAAGNRARGPRPQSASRGELLRRLRELVDAPESAAGQGTEDDALALPGLYRFASTELARIEAGVGPAPDAGDAAHFEVGELRRLVIRAHHRLFARRRTSSGALLRSAVRFFLVESPRAVLAEWKLVLGLLLVFYGLAAAAYLGVRSDLGLAYVLQDRAAVDAEVAQLRALEPGEAFRGNFTFGLDESGGASGFILANNIRVSLLFFASGLIPPLFLFILVSNALMLGTYLAVAAHWGQAGSIASILVCHGVIELQMIALAGAAGLVLARAWIAPGPWTRSHAMSRESRRAWALASPAIPFLFFSGFVEGYLSPHAPPAVRLATGAATGLLLALWLARGRRR